MNDVNDLCLRVAAAEERFKLVDERQRTYGSRLLGLMNVVESGLSRKQSALEHCMAELERVTVENEQLRELLNNLLHLVEANDKDRLDQSMQSLDAMVGALSAEDAARDEEEDRGQATGDTVPASDPRLDVLDPPGEPDITAPAEIPETASDLAFEPETENAGESELENDDQPSANKSPVGEIIDRISQRMNFPNEDVVMASLAKIEAGVAAAQTDTELTSEPETESGLSTGSEPEVASEIEIEDEDPGMKSAAAS